MCVTAAVPIPSRLSAAQVYAFTLPLALASFSDQNLLLLPPVVAVVAWVLFATEEIGHIIEDPFGRGLAPDPDNPAASDIPGSSQLEVLPLGRYCAEIAADVSMLAFSIEDRSIEEMPGACLPRRLYATGAATEGSTTHTASFTPPLQAATTTCCSSTTWHRNFYERGV